MKIAIEAQRIFRRNKHGMDFVVLEEIRELQKIDKENEYYIMVGPGEDNQVLSETENFRIVEVKCSNYVFWEQIALPLALRKIKPDVLHCTSNTAPLFSGKAKLILTLHDVIFLEQRRSMNKSIYQNLGWYYRKFIVPKILKRCVKIVTVSNYEAGKIAQALSINQGKISVVYNGYGRHFKPLEDYRDVTGKYTDHNKYIFFLGNTDPKKNTNRVIVGYSRYLKLSEFPLALIVADVSESTLDAILRQEGLESIRPYIVLTGYIPNNDLPSVYNGAEVFLYPSLRESFGIPILEAMACGTPVITSNLSAIPEIAGPGAILINPFNADEIGTKLHKLETDADFYRKQVEYGLERVKNFSWESTAGEILKIYNSIR